MADSDFCKLVQDMLAEYDQVPCRDEKGRSIYDELGRPLMNDDFCPMALEMIRAQRE